MIIPVILAGGSGTRLWPLSRELYPKQLLPLVGDRTMLQDTLFRVLKHEFIAAPVVICNQHHRFMVAEQLRELTEQASIIIEPTGRNTAPAVAVAALAALDIDDDPLLLVLPADHVIHAEEKFMQAVSLGVHAAEKGRLITFGIVPDSPETGYGYIKKGANADSQKGIYNVDSFVEKPDLNKAKEYIAAGEYLWNSGMFMFRAVKYLEELQKFAPDMLDCCRDSYEKRRSDLDFIRLEDESFAACPSDSIDYAVMEKTADAAVIPLDCGWNDVGSWSALWEIGAQDKDGNVLCGNVLTCNTKNSYINSSKRLVAAVGIEDLVIVETSDAVLVAAKGCSHDVKQIVNRLKEEKRCEASLHRQVFRPWGSYECVDSAARFQVKRIIVKPGARLSKQMHHHRAEHWIVVNGTARVTVGDKEFVVTENQSTYIPVGETHRLENPGSIPLEIIEVQSGSYLGEDDIVRFEDTYGRADS